MTERVCKNCKHWSKYNSQECYLPDWISIKSRVDDNTFAYYADALDDSGLDAGIKTGANFGCNKFESRGK